ncbi:MAG: 5'-methylthioadenosine/adenosylhomocysteine nucleosidase [Eubacterium sp.]
MKIGVIGAMDIEVSLLKSKMKITSAVTKAGMEFCEGTLFDCDVVVVQSGVGKVNAAACVQMLVDLFEVTCVINTGAAGSLDNRIEIGDLVVSSDLIYHDVNAVIFGYEPGQIPGMKQVSFPADGTLRRMAVNAIKEADPNIGIFEGRIASGDSFISTVDKKKEIAEKFGALCCEMEGAAVAQTCTINGVPFVVVRAISDKADGSEGKSYAEFEKKAAEDCARMVENLIRSFGKMQNE